MKTKHPSMPGASKFLVLVLVCGLVAACSPNVVAFTPTPLPPTAQPPSASVATAAAASGDASSPCIGVKDPTTNPPPGGSAKQWNAPENVTDASHTYCAIITTEKGRIVAELYPKAAPKNVNSFVFLAQQGFYDGVTWHRVLSGFMAQTGDPTGTGGGGPGYNNLPLEFDPAIRYDRAGRIGMARTNDPNTAGSQFFITFGPQPGLDQGGPNGGYTIIGQVVEGMNAVRQITLRDPQNNPPAPGDKLVSIRIVDVTAAK